MVIFRPAKVIPIRLIRRNTAYKVNQLPEQLAIIVNEAITKCCILNQ